MILDQQTLEYRFFKVSEPLPENGTGPRPKIKILRYILSPKAPLMTFS